MDVSKTKVTGGWKKMRKEHPSNLYSPPDVVRVMNQRNKPKAGHVVRTLGIRNAYRFY